MDVFNFRIVHNANGVDVFDTSLSTPYSSLTPDQMVEYTEADEQLSYMKSQVRKERKEQERMQKILRNPLYRLAAICGFF